MEVNTFKRILNEVLAENRFKKNGNHFQKNTTEVICSIGLQRSSYSNSCYINIGFIIKAINPDLLNPKYNDGDIRCRFSACNLNNASPGSFNLELIGETQLEEIRKCFNQNVQQLKKHSCRLLPI